MGVVNGLHARTGEPLDLPPSLVPTHDVAEAYVRADNAGRVQLATAVVRTHSPAVEYRGDGLGSGSIDQRQQFVVCPHQLTHRAPLVGRDTVVAVRSYDAHYGRVGAVGVLVDTQARGDIDGVTPPCSASAVIGVPR